PSSSAAPAANVNIHHPEIVIAPCPIFDRATAFQWRGITVGIGRPAQREGDTILYEPVRRVIKRRRLNSAAVRRAWIHAAAAASAATSIGCEAASRVLSSTGRRHTLLTYCSTFPARSTSRPRPSNWASCCRTSVPSLRISTTDTRGAPKLYLPDS